MSGWAQLALTLAALGVATWMVVRAVRQGGDHRRVQDGLPNLAAMDREPDVWHLSPPCGYDTWQLYPPDAERDRYNCYTGEPAATFDATSGPGRETADDPCQRLATIAPWARPWIEEVTGGRVVELVEGWGSPYGLGRANYEYAVLARVELGSRAGD